ncbi:MAG: hypothetical protein ACOY3N_10090 [Bradyrhizobium sp.]|jgi:hypothetical protein|uniref:hypothetical protein n=1 Tax=Bradyrhizobium TaxID=374 RepID=UPI0003FD88A3|nr:MULTISPECIES: hypothetical protein [Bradyrhizobium]KQT15223.1 hypothetical protein ASG57_32605 [Bradyrhizobium sp. Leaf396]
MDSGAQPPSPRSPDGFYGDGEIEATSNILLAVVDDKQQLLRLAAAPWIVPALLCKLGRSDA